MVVRNGKYILVVAPAEYSGKKYRERYVYKHHLIWWQHTGETPTTGFVVHHKNDDKHDNRFRNLEKKTVQRHSADHHAPAELTSVRCSWCDTGFAMLARVHRSRSKCGQQGFYCCRSHQVRAQQANRRGSREFHHGTGSAYSYHRCRCDDCKAAHARKQREYRRRGARLGPVVQ